jgi:hypothetical protein
MLPGLCHRCFLYHDMDYLCVIAAAAGAAHWSWSCQDASLAAAMHTRPRFLVQCCQGFAIVTHARYSSSSSTQITLVQSLLQAPITGAGAVEAQHRQQPCTYIPAH